jgi:RNA polymerase sigma-70 factor, ECF subfamily
MGKDRDTHSQSKTDPGLIERLQKSSQTLSWKEFDDIYRPRLYREARLKNLDHADAEDVAQNTILEFWKKMSNGKFVYDSTLGTLRGFLAKTIGWRIKDHRRKEKKLPRIAPRTPRSSSRSGGTVDRIPDQRPLPSEALADEDWSETLQRRAIQNIKPHANPKSYQLYEHLVLKNWPVAKVAEAFEVSNQRVYMARHRIQKLLDAEIERLKNSGV